MFMSSGSMSVVISVQTGFTGPVLESHLKCLKKCLSMYHHHIWFSIIRFLAIFRYVCDECRSAKENDEIYCLCRQPYDDSQYVFSLSSIPNSELCIFIGFTLGVKSAKTGSTDVVSVSCNRRRKTLKSKSCFFRLK